MGEKNGSSALLRIEQFNDNETEQVWELFKNEFQNASRQLDGELGWMLVSGGLSIEDINKQMPKEIVAKLVADVAMSASCTVPHENGLTVSCAVIDRNESGSKTC